MTPIEMRFQLHLAKAFCAAANGLNQDAAKQLLAAEAIVVDFEEDEKEANMPPPPKPLWCIRYRCPDPRWGNEVYAGAIGNCNADSLQLLTFTTEDSANAYARNHNIWKLVEVEMVMPPVESLK